MHLRPLQNAAPRGVPEAARVRLLVLGLMLLGAGAIVLGMPDPTWQLVAGSAIFYVSVLLYPIFTRRKADPFEPLIFTAVMSLFPFVAMLASFWVNGDVSLKFNENLSIEDRASLFAKVCLGSVLGFVCYWIGYRGRRIGPAVGRAFPTWGEGEWNRVKLRVSFVLLVAVSGLCYWIFHRELGGSLFDISEAGTGRNIVRARDVKDSWMSRGMLLVFVPTFLLLAQAASAKQRSKRLVRLAVFAVLLAFAALLISRTGGRGAFLLPVMVCLAIFHYMFRRVHVLVLAGLLIGGVVFTNFFGRVREYGRQGHDVEVGEVYQETSKDPVEALAAYAEERGGVAVQALVLHEFPANHDYLYGDSYKALAVALIPRWVWPGKTKLSSWHETNVVSILRPGTAGHPLSYMAALYVNFSWAGIILGFLVWGAFHRAMWEWLQRNRGNRSVVIVYVVTLLNLSPTVLGVAQSIQYVLPLVVLFFILQERRQPAPAAAQLPGVEPAPVRVAA